MIEQLIHQDQSYLLKGPETRRKEYRRLGARFEVDQDETLTLQLNLDLCTGALQTERTYCCSAFGSQSPNTITATYFAGADGPEIVVELAS